MEGERGRMRMEGEREWSTVEMKREDDEKEGSIEGTVNEREKTRKERASLERKILSVLTAR